ncbi:MAG: MarC family protein [Lactobacillales bacterium]|jgi:multiple antibiotic resistance protein|nr:MarC family protein [Lactobacillales bacterium]
MFFSSFSLADLLASFIVLFAVINPPGAIPVIIKNQTKGKRVNALNATIGFLVLFFCFFYIGEAFLRLFGVDISSFAIAGSIIVFLIGLELTLDIDIFKENTNISNDVTFIPIVFPLLVGAGGLTTLLSIRSHYADINVLGGVVLNAIVIYFFISSASRINRIIGKNVMFMIQKFFGIILLAISAKLFVTNIALLVETINHVK